MSLLAFSGPCVWHSEENSAMANKFVSLMYRIPIIQKIDVEKADINQVAKPIPSI
jgi:hypothetical protein